MTLRTCLALAGALAFAASAAAQPASGQSNPSGQPAPPRQSRAPSPPQPQQAQGPEYFLGTWEFSWIGRESPVTAGPRSGTATFTRIPGSDFLSMQIDGKSETGAAFKETAVLGWNAAQRSIAIRERLPNGTDVLSIGEWATPLAIHVDVQPVRIGSSTYRIRRTYNIGAAHAFDIVDELAVDGGPFQRLGKAEFTKAAAAQRP
jgi:hypothetical protein